MGNKKWVSRKNLPMIAIIAFAAAVLIFSVYTAVARPNYYGSDYQKAMNAQSPDKCATPPGYTDAQWQQHMSHHPDIYADCLK